MLRANVQTPLKGLAVGMLAGLAAKPTSLATRSIYPKLGSWRKTFGVMTPDATQRTSLEKDRGANPLAVPDGKFLNVKNQSVHIKACTPDVR